MSVPQTSHASMQLAIGSSGRSSGDRDQGASFLLIGCDGSCLLVAKSFGVAKGR